MFETSSIQSTFIISETFLWSTLAFTTNIHWTTVCVTVAFDPFTYVVYAPHARWAVIIIITFCTILDDIALNSNII